MTNSRRATFTHPVNQVLRSVAWAAALLVSAQSTAYAVATTLYITSGNSATGGFLNNRVLSYDLATQQLSQFVAGDRITGIEATNDGRVYVAQHFPAGYGVDEYDSNGQKTRNFIAPGIAGLTGAGDIQFGPDRSMYVVGNGNSIYKFSTSGSFQRVLGSGPVDGLSGAYDVVFDLNGNALVSSAITNSIFRYDLSGAFIDEFVTPSLAGLSSPKGLAMGPDGDLYVASLGNDAIYRFDGSTGGFVEIALNGGRIDDPYDIEFGSDGYLYIAESSPSADRVSIWDLDAGLRIDSFFVADPSYLAFDTATGPSAVPIPAAVWLFGSGLLGLIGIARRREV